MDELISVIIKEPGKAPKRKTIKNTLRAFQQTVNGHIEVFPIGVGVIGVVNEDGIPLALPFNCEIAGHEIYGTLIVCSTDGENFASLPYEIELEERR